MFLETIGLVIGFNILWNVARLLKSRRNHIAEFDCTCGVHFREHVTTFQEGIDLTNYWTAGHVGEGHRLHIFVSGD